MSDNGGGQAEQTVEKKCAFWGKKCSEVNGPEVPEEEKCNLLLHLKGTALGPLGGRQPVDIDGCMIELMFNQVNQFMQLLQARPGAEPIGLADQKFRR